MKSLRLFSLAGRASSASATRIIACSKYLRGCPPRPQAFQADHRLAPITEVDEEEEDLPDERTGYPHNLCRALNSSFTARPSNRAEDSDSEDEISAPPLKKATPSKAKAKPPAKSRKRTKADEPVAEDDPPPAPKSRKRVDGQERTSVKKGRKPPAEEKPSINSTSTSKKRKAKDVLEEVEISTKRSKTTGKKAPVSEKPASRSVLSILKFPRAHFVQWETAFYFCETEGKPDC